MTTESTADTPHTPDKPGIQARRTPLVSSWAALKQLGAAFSNAGLKVRKEDKYTAILMACAALSATAIFLFPQQSAPIGGLFDVFFAASMVSYFAQRLGIFTTLNERQTLFIGELLMASVVLGMFIAVNCNIILSSLRDMIVNSTTLR